jgi:hypothetical protein
MNLFLYTKANSINAVDPNGLDVIGPIFNGDKPVIAPYSGPNPCDGYKSCMGSKCCRDGKSVEDPYPAAAYSVCNGFMKQYDYENNPTVRCVARCLVAEEKTIQAQYSDCGDRNSARIRAHMKCYASCGFVPTHGLPPGGADVGWGMLLPDFVEDPFSIW